MAEDPPGQDPKTGQDPAEEDTSRKSETDPPAEEGKTFDEAYVKQLRSEAAANRKKAADLEARLKTIDDEKLSETERLKRQADEAAQKLTAAEGKARARLAKAETLTQAAALNLVDGDTAFALIQGQIEFDDEGEPTNVAALLKQLAKDKPFLVKSAGGDQSPANPPGGRSATGEKLDPKRPPSWGGVFKR